MSVASAQDPITRDFSAAGAGKAEKVAKAAFRETPAPPLPPSPGFAARFPKNVASVRRRQNRLGLGMVHHVLAQQVKSLGTSRRKLPGPEAQVAVRE